MWERIRQRSAEISHPLSGGRDLRRKHNAPVLATPLFIPEKEDLVLLDWAAEVEAIVVVLQLSLRLSGSVKKEISSIQFVTAQKLKAGSVKLVAAAFSNQIDHGALGLTVLSAEAVTLDTELLNRIDRRKDEQGGDSIRRPYC